MDRESTADRESSSRCRNYGPLGAGPFTTMSSSSGNKVAVNDAGCSSGEAPTRQRRINDPRRVTAGSLRHGYRGPPKRSAKPESLRYTTRLIPLEFRHELLD